MAELAAVASVIGIATPALQGIKSVYNFIDGMKEAPSGVKRISLELKELQRVLKTIPTQDNAVPIVHTISQEMGLKEVIVACDKACLDFVEKLKQWMPSPDEPSMLDRVKVQAHRKTINTCRDIVRDTKGTVVLAEVVAVKRLAVETLRQQGMLSDAVAAVLYQESTDQALAAKTKADETAQLDKKRDKDDEHDTTQYDAMELDMARETSTDDEVLGATSVPDFEDMIKEASRRGIQLSKSVVKQRFGNLEMEDDNDVNQGIDGKVDGEVYQIFGDAKIGSGNKLQQGVYRRRN